MFEDLAAAGLQPSVVTYNALLAAHAQSGAWQAALDCLQRMLRTVRSLASGVQVSSALVGLRYAAQRCLAGRAVLSAVHAAHGAPD